MINNDFMVEPATWAVDMAELREIRTEVFVVEQEVPADEEWDDLDAGSQHVIARDAHGEPIGTGRLTPVGTIGRMAIVRGWRGKGVGEAILRVLLERARDRHFTSIEIHAQTHAIPFYERSGFVAYGEAFDECGIAHRHMRIALAPTQTRDNPASVSPTPNALSSTDREQARAAILEVLATTRRQLAIFTRDLDPDLLGHDDILEAIKRIAVAGPHARIRILVLEPARARMQASVLVALAQRLTSVFEFRTPVEEIDFQYPGSFVINDRGAWFERALAIRFDGEGSTYAPGRTAQLQTLFDSIWERSEPSAELRRLEI